MARIQTRDLLDAVVDEGTWRSWDAPVTDPVADRPYADELAAARAASGADESITCGSARIAGLPVAVVAGDFEFLGGSVGEAAARRVVNAVERATSLGMSLVGLPNSGGTRVQEGTSAFLMMISIAAAIRRHRDAGLPYLVYLRHPTTGGVFATWGSLADVTHAQPGALLAFLGPRVYEGIYGEPFPEGIQTAEHLAECGVIDGVATPDQWRDIAARLLEAWHSRPSPAEAAHWEISEPSHMKTPATPTTTGESVPVVASGWQAVLETRRPHRAGLAELLDLTTDIVRLSGTQRGEVAAATVLAVARLEGIPCLVVGQDRAAQESGKMIGPGDLRFVQRGIDLAGRWRIPLLLVVDTQGGELSAAAESGAMAGEVGRCLSELVDVPTPTICLLLGGGCGAAALALVPADRVLASWDAWISPLPPEGASMIKFRSPGRADVMADAQRVTVSDLQADGAVDRIVPGPRDMAATVAAVAEELARLSQVPVDYRNRADRWVRQAQGERRTRLGN